MNALCFTGVNPDFTPFNLKQYAYPYQIDPSQQPTLRPGANQVNYFITDGKGAGPNLAGPPVLIAQAFVGLLPYHLKLPASSRSAHPAPFAAGVFSSPRGFRTEPATFQQYFIPHPHRVSALS